MDMENQEYEFSDSQNELIRDLSGKMNLFSIIMLVVGILGILAGLAAVARGGLLGAVQGITNAVVGLLTMRAAKSFKLIVETEGRDIENLMAALGELRNLYTFQIVLIILAFIGGFIIGLVSALSAR
ncbi:MAG: hypothetical protein RML75_04390 [Cyanobacteriota bacterium SKYGB_h_bin112]|nr:hypothetical protein [Cyanobacteriota bacterium SKYGB_h_bin112]